LRADDDGWRPLKGRYGRKNRTLRDRYKRLYLNNSVKANFDTIILGAGLSGLTTAYRLTKQGYRVLVLEKNDRPGGAVLSYDLDGFLCEGGPNSLQETPAFISLVKELGLEERLVFADSKSPRFVYWKNKLVPVPLNPPAFVTSSLISPLGKLKAALEFFVPRGVKDESIAEFVERRLGREILVKLVAPFISGVFAGNPYELSVADALPRLKALEDEHGSLLRSLLKGSKKKQGPGPIKRLCSFKNGLAELPYALSHALGQAVQYQSNVQRFERSSDDNGSYRIYLEDGRSYDATTVICTSPAYITATLLADFLPKAAQELNQIIYPAAATVCLAYPNAAFSTTSPSPCSTGGFGHLVPREQGVRSLGGIWNSSLFPGRAPEGWQLITCFIGGTTDPEAQHLSEADLFQTAHRDLQTVLGVTGNPKNVSLTLWKKAIPQYGMGHGERIAKILGETERLPGFYLAANYIDGVALGDCFTRANRQVDTIIEFLKTRPVFIDRGVSTGPNTTGAAPLV
jgi:protoporphyrinogen/coproporphyrinogen III oxidase